MNIYKKLFNIQQELKAPKNYITNLVIIITEVQKQS